MARMGKPGVKYFYLLRNEKEFSFSLLQRGFVQGTSIDCPSLMIRTGASARREKK
jgi:hypothetical protein